MRQDNLVLARVIELQRRKRPEPFSDLRRLTAAGLIFAGLVASASSLLRDHREFPEGSRAERKAVSSGADMMQRLAGNISNSWQVRMDFSSEVVRVAFEAGEHHRLDPVLILSVIAAESGFDPSARSSAGADGLMQVIYRWHREKADRYGHIGYRENIMIGSQVLREYIDRENGDVKRALQRYNGSLSDASQSYANRIIRFYRKLDALRIENSPPRPPLINYKSQNSSIVTAKHSSRP